jgi:hypothetical protein
MSLGSEWSTAISQPSQRLFFEWTLTNVARPFKTMMLTQPPEPSPVDPFPIPPTPDVPEPIDVPEPGLLVTVTACQTNSLSNEFVGTASTVL